MMLALSDYTELQRPSAAESIFSDTYEGHMSTFLSHLAFWQDVLEHCKSDNVRQTLLDHFQILFLQQLLCVSPPSLLNPLANVHADTPLFYSLPIPMEDHLLQCSLILPPFSSHWIILTWCT